MKIQNVRIDFKQPTRHRDDDQPKYWAIYYSKQYVGVYTMDELKELATYWPPKKVLTAYPRKSTTCRGKSGQYELVYYGAYRTEVTYLKNRTYAIRRALELSHWGHRITLTDRTTGELLFEQKESTKHERNDAGRS